MALWPVADKATAQLMELVYRGYFSGLSPGVALLQAQREALASQRERKEEPNPFLWAAFVASVSNLNTNNTEMTTR